jgi:four helix bundle protein
MKENIITKKAFAFSVRIVNLYKYLTAQKKEYIISRQVCKSGTSIGANIAEAQRGQTKADFVAKMSISLKEANETMYWLMLLYRTDILTTTEYESLYKDLDEILSLLTAICKTATL